MSLATVRTQIKEALSTIDGVTGYEKEPRAPIPGDAWIQSIGILWDAGLPEVTWKVWLVLPQNEDSAINWFETNAEDIRDGLHDYCPAYVDGISTTNLSSTNSPVYGLEITLRS